MNKNIFKLLKYLPLIVLGLTPVIWFWDKGNVLIDGVDTNFPLDPLSWFLRRLYVWNSVANGGSDFSSSTAGLFFHLIQLIPYQLGFSLQTIEIMNLIFWFMLIVFSSFQLARAIFPKNIYVQMIFVVFYAFNIYLFNTWENVKVANLALMSALPFGIMLLIRLYENTLKKDAAVVWAIVVGLILSGSGINPAYFISFFLIIFIVFLSIVVSRFNKKSIKENVLNFLTICIPVLLINSFWIFPTFYYIFHNIPASGSLDRIGFTNWVDSLSNNTSIFNIIRVQGAWDWYAVDSATGTPLFISYALNYFYSIPFLIFSFLVPSLAIVSFFIKDKSRGFLYISFGSMMILGIFLGVGTHLPTGYLFRFLLENVPFMSMFRSPWYIFTPFIIIAYAGLIGLLFWNLTIRASKLKNSFPRKIVYLFALFLIIGNLVYCYPLLTGKIFRPNRPDSFFVEIPSYVLQAKDEWFNDKYQGRIIGYPDDEIENFNWGYRGIETILALIGESENLFSPLNAPDAPIANIIKEYYWSLKKKHIETASNLAYKLNIKAIFEKNDQGSLSPALPEEVKQSVLKKSGSWVLYDVSGLQAPSKIYPATSLVYGYPERDNVKILGLLGRNNILVNLEDTVVQKIPDQEINSNFVVSALNDQKKQMKDFLYSPSKLSNRLASKVSSKVNYSFNIMQGGNYQPVLEKDHLDSFGLNKVEGITVEIDGRKDVWKMDRETDSYIYFNSIFLEEGDHTISFLIENRNLVKGGDFEDNNFNFEVKPEGIHEVVADLNREISIKWPGLYCQNNTGSLVCKDNSYLSTKNITEQDISASFRVSDFDPFSSYLIEVNYKQVYGDNASVLTTQRNKNTLIKSQVERLPNYPEWNLFSFYFDPVRTGSSFSVSLVTPAVKDPLGTKLLYDNLAVYQVFTNDLLLVKSSENQESILPSVVFQKISPVEYQGEVTDGEKPHLIVFSENYSPEWEISLFDEDGGNIKMSPLHFTANTYANAWYMENTPAKYSFKIYYKPQKYFIMGMAISLGVIIITVTYFLLKGFKRLPTR